MEWHRACSKHTRISPLLLFKLVTSLGKGSTLVAVTVRQEDFHVVFHLVQMFKMGRRQPVLAVAKPGAAGAISGTSPGNGAFPS